MNRPFFQIVLWLIVVCQVGCASLENRFVYHPVRDQPADVVKDSFGKDVFLKTAAGEKIHARWYPHPGATGAIIYCPGNAGNLHYRTRLVRELWQQLGESVLIFDYPGYGRSDGQPSEVGCYAAAETVYDWLTRTRKIPHEHIVIYGESLGGGVAVHLASRKKHRALVLVRTFTSMPEVAQAHFPYVPLHLLMWNRFDNVSRLAQCRRPVFIAYGEKDKLIPADHGLRLARAPAGVVRLHVLKGLGHNDAPGPDFYTSLRRFLDEPTAQNLRRADIRKVMTETVPTSRGAAQK